MFIMNGINPEHMLYSFGPKFATQASQRAGKTGRGLHGIPRGHHEGAFIALLQQIPQSHHRVKPQAQSRRSFGPLAFERLGLLASHQLLGVFERVFDGPAIGVSTNHSSRVHRHIGGEKKLVFLFAFRIAADDQQDGLVRNAVPENLSSVNQSGSDSAPLAHFYFLPMANLAGQFLRTEKSLASFARPTAAFGFAILWASRKSRRCVTVAKSSWHPTGLCRPEGHKTHLHPLETLFRETMGSPR